MFALGSAAGAKKGAPPIALLRVGERFWPLAASAKAARIGGLPDSTYGLFADWATSFPKLSRVATAIEAGKVPARLALPAKRARLVTPIVFPRKVICTGANYLDHLVEMNAAHLAEKTPGVAPFFFLKPPSTCLVGPGKTVRMPEGCDYLDWEVEFAVVFGRGGRHIREKDAMRHVAGYSVAIDFTSRNQLVVPQTFFKFNFVLGKSQDTMNPLGPVVVPKQFLEGRDARFALYVNGVKKQDARTSSMIYSLPEQIAGVSRYVAIEAGDVMLTGSPAGVGLPRGERLVPGDVVRIEADAIGAMEVVIQPAIKSR